jgi:hypothetical protein
MVAGRRPEYQPPRYLRPGIWLFGTNTNRVEALTRRVVLSGRIVWLD